MERRMSTLRPTPFDIGPVHFVGIGGIGMSGIAEIMLRIGYKVQGSDAKASANTERLAALGAEIFVGHDAAQRRKRRRRGLFHRGQAGQSRAFRRPRAPHSPRAPSRNAGRADAAAVFRRRGRHAWQDHHHLDGRLPCSMRAT